MMNQLLSSFTNSAKCRITVRNELEISNYSIFEAMDIKFTYRCQKAQTPTKINLTYYYTVHPFCIW